MHLHIQYIWLRSYANENSKWNNNVEVYTCCFFFLLSYRCLLFLIRLIFIPRLFPIVVHTYSLFSLYRHESYDKHDNNKSLTLLFFAVCMCVLLFIVRNKKNAKKKKKNNASSSSKKIFFSRFSLLTSLSAAESRRTIRDTRRRSNR